MMYRPLIFSAKLWRFILYLGAVLSLFGAELSAQPGLPLPPPPGGEIDLEPSEGGDTKPGSSLEEAAAKMEAENAKKNEEDRKRRDAQRQEANQEEDEKDILALKRQVQLPEARIWGQQFFRDQSLSLFTRTRDIKALESYRLGPGDELMINVWGRAVFSANVIVDESGHIDMSGAGVLIPRVYIKNMRIADARKLIVERLSRHMDVKGSQWAIELNYSRNIVVNITGEVFNPGSYSVPATNTAFNALVASGGPSQIGSVRKIQVASPDKSIRVLDIYKFVTNPNIADEFFLSNNDYVYVPLAERVVQVQGSVKRPFFYELIKGENLQALLQYAGGLEPDAYRTNIQIKRYIQDEEKLIDLNLGQMQADSLDFELLNGDVIVVAPIKQAYSNYVKVVGAVKLPGEYELEKGLRVRDALMKSGIIYSAVMDRIYIKRLREDLTIEYINSNVFDILTNPDHPENILLRPLDEIEVKFKSEFIDKFYVRVHGAVRQPGEYQYSKNLTLADVLYMSNGIRQEATRSTIEISRLEKVGDSTVITFRRYPIDDSLRVANADQIILEPFDQIFIRSSKAFELPRNVSISGEVGFPGTYTLASRKERVWDLLKRCGGTTEIAFLEGAQLYRNYEGLVLLDLRSLYRDSVNSPFNYILQEGDRIVIPRVKDLVSLAGAVRHPAIREKNEIAELELELELKKLQTDLERQERLIAVQIERKKSPTKVNVPFHVGKRANFYIQHYGAGLDRRNGGRSHLVFVRYANGKVKRARVFLCFRFFPKVDKGAMVFAEPKLKKPRQYRQRQPIDLALLLRNSLATATSILTLVFLARAINP